MKQKGVIWTLIGALIISECFLGVAVQGEQNVCLAVGEKKLLIWEFAPNCENGLEYVVLKNTGPALCLNRVALLVGEGKTISGAANMP
ncbi:MAG: hypothetical protein QXH13_04885, partial [Thermoplasmata archaeon]